MSTLCMAHAGGGLQAADEGMHRQGCGGAVNYAAVNYVTRAAQPATPNPGLEIFNPGGTTRCTGGWRAELTALQTCLRVFFGCPCYSSHVP